MKKRQILIPLFLIFLLYFNQAFANSEMNHRNVDVVVDNEIVTKNIACLSKEDDYAVIRLDLRWLELQEIPFVSRYLNLKELQLDGNQIADITPISFCYQLRTLSFLNNRLQDITPLEYLSELENLSIGNNVNIKDISPIEKLENLRGLAMQNCGVENIASLENLINLESLNIAGNPIKDYSPLLSLKKLRYLYIVDGELNAPFLKKLQSALPNCKISLVRREEMIVSDDAFAQSERQQGEILKNVPFMPPAARIIDGDSVTFSGTGNASIPRAELKSPLSRMTISGDATFMLTEGYTGSLYMANEKKHCTFFHGPITYSGYVIGRGDWIINIEPIKEGGSATTSGRGEYVSDIFMLSEPSLVKITLDASEIESEMACVDINLMWKKTYENTNGEIIENQRILSKFLFAKNPNFSEEILIVPIEGHESYFWEISAMPGLRWSIEVN